MFDEQPDGDPHGECAAEIHRLQQEVERVKRGAKMLGECIHNMVVAQQSAWIEWQHGKGAEAAMSWIHNGLVGPGHIPDEDEPYGKEAQAWYDANNAEPLPTCKCGRPSNIAWMGQGFCSEAHYREAKAAHDAGVPQPRRSCGDGCNGCEECTDYGDSPAERAAAKACPESGKHCKVIDGECQTCGAVGVTPCEGGQKNG